MPLLPWSHLFVGAAVAAVVLAQSVDAVVDLLQPLQTVLYKPTTSNTSQSQQRQYFNIRLAPNHRNTLQNVQSCVLAVNSYNIPVVTSSEPIAQAETYQRQANDVNETLRQYASRY